MTRRPKPARISRVHRKLLGWYQQHGRDLPWRRTRDPYAILVSEIMLQQTQVQRVIPKYRAWLRKWPTVHKLAQAKNSDILRMWSGLGYNRRALYLKRAAQQIVAQHAGRVPAQPEVLRLLPGIGAYTSKAVAAFSFQQPAAMIDTNIRRILRRVYAWPGQPSERELEGIAEANVPARAPDLWHHALMDLGALICVSGRPACPSCPLQAECRAYPAILKTGDAAIKKQGAFKDSDRFWRGRVVAVLLPPGQLTETQLLKTLRPYGQIARLRLKTILQRLAKDKVIHKFGQAWDIQP